MGHKEARCVGIDHCGHYRLLLVKQVGQLKQIGIGFKCYPVLKCCASFQGLKEPMRITGEDGNPLKPGLGVVFKLTLNFFLILAKAI